MYDIHLLLDELAHEEADDDDDDGRIDDDSSDEGEHTREVSNHKGEVRALKTERHGTTISARYPDKFPWFTTSEWCKIDPDT